jgi:hypothetical protein
MLTHLDHACNLCMQQNRAYSKGTFCDFSKSPILRIPLRNQKQFPRRFSSFQIPMGLLRILQGIKMLDAQL